MRYLVEYVTKLFTVATYTYVITLTDICLDKDHSINLSLHTMVCVYILHSATLNFCNLEFGDISN
jgi:hypothetical protein